MLVALLWSASAHAGLFDLLPYPDTDRDGIDDRHDACLFLAETPNGYADHDGCPDYLTPLTAVAQVQGVRVPAQFVLTSPSGGTRGPHTGPALQATVEAGEHVVVEASYGCLRARERLFAGSGIEEIALDLLPQWDARIGLHALGTTGGHVPGTQVEILESPGPGCAPAGPIAIHANSVIRVGSGSYRLRISAPGHEPQVVDVLADRSGRALQLTLAPIEEAQTPQGDLDTEPLRVTFATNRVQLSATDARRVHRLGTYLSAHPQLGPVVVTGHTDERGDPIHNIALAMARAEAVSEVLVAAGVDPTQLTVQAAGESEPLVGASNSAAWSLNRRVEIDAHPEAIAAADRAPGRS